MIATEGVIVADLSELLGVQQTLKIAKKASLGGGRTTKAVLTPAEGGMNVALRGTGTNVLFRIGTLSKAIRVGAPDFVALLASFQKLGDPSQPVAIVLHADRVEFRGGALAVALKLV